jgi:hypothetical protein
MEPTTSSKAWKSWQDGVVEAITQQFGGMFLGITRSDVDWETWRWLHEQGRSPSSAVAHAFLTER